MKYKKFITITLIAILLCTSISIGVGGKVSSEKVSDLETKSLFRGRIFDFFSKIIDAVKYSDICNIFLGYDRVAFVAHINLLKPFLTNFILSV